LYIYRFGAIKQGSKVQEGSRGNKKDQGYGRSTFFLCLPEPHQAPWLFFLHNSGVGVCLTEAKGAYERKPLGAGQTMQSEQHAFSERYSRQEQGSLRRDVGIFLMWLIHESNLPDREGSDHLA
jgi:hypothetical protein